MLKPQLGIPHMGFATVNPAGAGGEVDFPNLPPLATRCGPEGKMAVEHNANSARAPREANSLRGRVGQRGGTTYHGNTNSPGGGNPNSSIYNSMTLDGDPAGPNCTPGGPTKARGVRRPVTRGRDGSRGGGGAARKGREGRCDGRGGPQGGGKICDGKGAGAGWRRGQVAEQMGETRGEEGGEPPTGSKSRHLGSNQNLDNPTAALHTKFTQSVTQTNDDKSVTLMQTKQTTELQNLWKSANTKRWEPSEGSGASDPLGLGARRRPDRRGG